MAQRQQGFVLQGGLDVVTPRSQVPPGRVQASLNYEPDVRGYTRVEGYERFSGRPKPSEATWIYVAFANATQAILPGNVFTGATSGATGTAMLDAVLSSGSYGGANVGTVALRTVTGEFIPGETLTYFGTATLTSALADGSGDAAELAAFILTETERRRSLIARVGNGSGPVRGVQTFNGDVYAFRDNFAGTAGQMFKATATGWVAQALGSSVAFTLGTAEVFEGETLTQGGATGVIRRVAVSGGTWSGTARGRLVVEPIGGVFAPGIATTASGSLTLSGALVASSLPPGGRYVFANHNFYGLATAGRMYGANGVGQAFEWDGDVFCPIDSNAGSGLDKPTHVAEFNNHLFLAFDGGAILYSGIGQPLEFTVLAGGGEMALGVDVTALLENAQTSLVVLGRTKVAYLQGRSALDFQLVSLADDAGGLEHTAQVIGQPMFLDNLGIRDMRATQTFANWRMGAVSQLVEPLITSKRRSGAAPVASMRVRGKDQYRVFYDDRSGFTVYVGRKNPEILPFRLEFDATCACSGEDADGSEVLFMGDAEGFVYELDAGTSYDGAPILAFLRHHFYSPQGTGAYYRFHSVELEIDGTASMRLALTSDYSYGAPDTPGGTDELFDITGGGAFWDAGALFEEFYWDAAVQGTARAYLDGMGTNCSICVISESATEPAHTLSSLRFNYTPRKAVR